MFHHPRGSSAGANSVSSRGLGFTAPSSASRKVSAMRRGLRTS
jgi:hypothetical protein